MIVLFWMIPVGLLALDVWAFRSVWNRRRYRRCLANTALLERELFPQWFPQPTKVERAWMNYEYGPGAVWPVDGHDKVRWLENTITGTEMLQRAHAMQGTTMSARFAADIQRVYLESKGI